MTPLSYLAFCVELLTHKNSEKLSTSNISRFTMCIIICTHTGQWWWLVLTACLRSSLPNYVKIIIPCVSDIHGKLIARNVAIEVYIIIILTSCTRLSTSCLRLRISPAFSRRTILRSPSLPLITYGNGCTHYETSTIFIIIRNYILYIGFLMRRCFDNSQLL